MSETPSGPRTLLGPLEYSDTGWGRGTGCVWSGIYSQVRDTWNGVSV